MQQEEWCATVSSDISIYSLIVEDKIYFQLRLTQMRLAVPQTQPTGRLAMVFTCSKSKGPPSLPGMEHTH